MSPDQNPIEHLWRDLKTKVGIRHPSNLRHLEQLEKEEKEWSKIPVERCKKLIDGCRFFFLPKGVLPNIKFRVAIILSSPFLEFCVESDLGFFHQIFLVFPNANKINKHVDTKAFVIATIFWEKWCIIWQKCRGANIFDHDC